MNNAIFLDYCKEGNEDKLIQYVLSRKVGESGGLLLESSVLQLLESFTSYSLESNLTSWDKYLLFKETARILAERRLYNKLIQFCDDSLNIGIPGLNKELKIWMYYYKYIAFYNVGDDVNARQYCLYVMQQAELDMESYPLFEENSEQTHKFSIKRKAMDDFKTCDDNFAKQYLELPYNDRKMLFVVKEYTDLFQSHLSVIDINKVSNTGIEFPTGHPMAYQLYVGHPCAKQKYLKFENYELELIEDKVREFCYLVQCLGAKEVSVECLNSSSSNTDTKTKQHIGGRAAYKIFSASADYESSQSKHLIDKISQSINLHQKFNPQKEPYLPENLYWYPTEPSWQRLYHQRMHGSLLQYEERIETKKNRVFEGTELKSIKGELKILLSSVNIQWDKEEEEKFELSENATLVIRVNFVPLNKLNGKKANIVPLAEQSEIYLGKMADEIANNGRNALKKVTSILKLSSLNKAEKE